LLVCTPAATRAGRTYVLHVDRRTGTLGWTGHPGRDVFASEAEALAFLATPASGHDGVRQLRSAPAPLSWAQNAG
jgi:hypothetical protein